MTHEQHPPTSSPVGPLAAIGRGALWVVSAPRRHWMRGTLVGVIALFTLASMSYVSTDLVNNGLVWVVTVTLALGLTRRGLTDGSIPVAGPAKPWAYVGAGGVALATTALVLATGPLTIVAMIVSILASVVALVLRLYQRELRVGPYKERYVPSPGRPGTYRPTTVEPRGAASHYNKDGHAKRGYNQQWEALDAVRDYERDFPGETMSAYQCGSCSQWHIGHAR